MKKHFFRKLTCYALTLIMLLSVLPVVPAFAAPVVSEYTAAPQFLRVPALAYDESSIVIAWDKPDDYYESAVPIADYEVFIDGVSAGLSSVNFAENYEYINAYYDAFYKGTAQYDHYKVKILSFTAVGLEPATDYAFEVRAVYEDGAVSGMSEALEARTADMPYIVDAVDFGAAYVLDVRGQLSTSGLGTNPDPALVAYIESNTAAIQAAIDATPFGGKTVLKGSGDNANPYYYVSGSIFLHSNMTFEVEEGAVLLGSPRADDYPRNMLVYSYSQDIRTQGLVNAITYDLGTLENIRIVGKGAIDGNGCTASGTAYANTRQPISYQTANTGLDPKAADYGDDPTGNNWRIRGYSSAGIVSTHASGLPGNQDGSTQDMIVSSRTNNTRPNLMVVRGVDGIYYGGITIYNPGFHGIVNYESDNVVTNGVIAMTWNCGNGDGIEFGDCRGITVMNSFWDTGDDAINFAAGQGADQRNLTEISATGHFTGEGEGYGRIVNSFVRNGHGGLLALGSHTGGWLGNMMAEENVYNSCETGTNGALRLKANASNGGGVRNIIFRDNAINHTANPGSATVRLEPGYTDGGASTEWPYVSDFPVSYENVFVRNITQTGASTAVFLGGGPSATTTSTIVTPQSLIRNFHVEDVRILSSGTGNKAGIIEAYGIDTGYFKNINRAVEIAPSSLNITVLDCGANLDQNSIPVSLEWGAGATLTATVSGNDVALSWPAVDNAERYSIYVDILDDGGFHGYELMQNNITATSASFKLMENKEFNVAIRPERAGKTTYTGSIANLFRESPLYGELLEAAVTTGAGSFSSTIVMPANTGTNRNTRVGGSADVPRVGTTWQNLTWTWPSINGVTPASNNTGYLNVQYVEIEATPAIGEVKTYRAYMESPTRAQYTIWGLEDGMNYSVRLRVVAWDGNVSDWYNSLEITTVPQTHRIIPEWDEDATLEIVTKAIRVGDPLEIKWNEDDVTSYAGKVYDTPGFGLTQSIIMSEFAGYRVMVNGAPIQPANVNDLYWPADQTNSVATVGLGTNSFIIDTSSFIPGITYYISVEAGDDLPLYATAARSGSTQSQQGYRGAQPFRGQNPARQNLKRNQVSMGKWTGHGPAYAFTLLAANEYIVSFDYNGGDAGIESKVVTLNGEYGELPEAFRGGYIFVGWSLDGTVDTIVTADTIMDTPVDHTLIAVWEEIVFVSAEVTSFNKNLQDKNNSVKFTVTVTMSDGSTFTVEHTEKINGGQKGSKIFDYGDYKVSVAWNDNNTVTKCEVDTGAGTTTPTTPGNNQGNNNQGNNNQGNNKGNNNQQ